MKREWEKARKEGNKIKIKAQSLDVISNNSTFGKLLGAQIIMWLKLYELSPTQLRYQQTSKYSTLISGTTAVKKGIGIAQTSVFITADL